MDLLMEMMDWKAGNYTVSFEGGAFRIRYRIKKELIIFPTSPKVPNTGK